MVLFKFNKYLVSKFSYNKDVNLNKNNLKVKILKNKEDLNIENEWFNNKKNFFDKLIDEGNIGIVLFSPQNNDVIGYGWMAISKFDSCPEHLSKIPRNSAWIHFDRIKENYQGNGYYKFLLKKRVEFLKKEYEVEYIYIDTSKNNIPARIAQKKVGFSELGIYYVLSIGTKKITSCFYQIGYWFKNKKHPKIKT